MADFLCADWDEDDFDTDCTSGYTRSVTVDFEARRVTVTETI